MSLPDLQLDLAAESDLGVLLPLVAAYHAFEQVDMTDAQRAAALAPLLRPQAPEGRVWLVRRRGEAVGYVAVCFGYSIEFRGRDAFLDELYIAEPFRGQGIGRAVVEQTKRLAAALGLRALHLEVTRDNERARKLYGSLGFEARTRFHLMSCSLADRPA